MMNSTKIIPRQTKYCQAIEKYLSKAGHATNAELLDYLRRTSFPGLSATTVHRASARLAERGAIAQAPSTHDGIMQYDSNTSPHDHFMCLSCGVLRDADVLEKVASILESSISDCQISGRLTINGICKKCKSKSTEILKSSTPLNQIN